MNIFHQQHRTKLLIVGAALVVACAGWIIGSHFLLGSVAVAGLMIAFVVFGWPEIALIASIGTIVLGQLIRIPIGSDGTIIPNDVIVPALIIAWLLRRLASGTWKLHRHSLTTPISAMVLVMFLSLVLNIGREDMREWLNGALYFIRWIEYALLFWIALDIFETRDKAWRYVQGITVVAVVLAVLGFIQLKLFPDFSFMVPQGWDPHVGRLLSTWFDPNYLGGLFAVCAAITLAISMSHSFRQARWWWIATALLSLAEVLTFSRSGYVGFVLALGFVVLIRSRAVAFLGLLALISVVVFVPRVQERVIGIRTVDETAQLRLVSYRNAFTVIGDHPYFGIGYNLYKYVQVEYNFLEKTTEHSASGSDSSILSIWVTTGTIGVVVYLWLFFALLRELWKTWRDTTLPRVWQGFGLGAFAGVLGLIAHSQFVNGLQYPHLMEVVWLLVAIAIAVRQPKRV